jgi:phosphoglycolate phosphatase-like HAD superfamily hydrolase
MQSRARPSLSLFALLTVLLTSSGASAQPDPLPSWDNGATKKAVIAFVHDTTDSSSPNYVPPESRVATFDQDGTTWVEHPVYTQVVFCLDRVSSVVAKHPELRDAEPFKTVLSGNQAAIAKLTKPDFEKIAAATLSGMTVDEFTAEARRWIANAKDHRWQQLYTQLTYEPMLEMMKYLRASGYTVYIVTGGGQDFVRAYSQDVYGAPPQQVVGTAGAVTYGYSKEGTPILTKDPKLLLNDDNAGKPEGIHLVIGQRPQIAFGNSTGDRQMLEYTTGGGGKRLGLLVLHDDAQREYAYGPAQGLPDTKVGTFTQQLYDEAKSKGWIVISMKNDWNRIFPFEKARRAPKTSSTGSGFQVTPSSAAWAGLRESLTCPDERPLHRLAGAIPGQLDKVPGLSGRVTHAEDLPERQRTQLHAD